MLQSFCVMLGLLSAGSLLIVISCINISAARGADRELDDFLQMECIKNYNKQHKRKRHFPIH